ncbi:50S ribosomal protein L4 [Candidatus Curtissbacteria bacterium RBG_13_40_7]|uniref:Large ribosomal subunit protein uL4 n=1 Tax=Candidatus Curtissbacteria bacterium RBG_13_40_7 TaxID=1797706 RepID=A0A1F5FVK1_9BACT|nr:MAG: 50S ribosomal protein L4 [Candidatus Curtissbacteria bacterium RBG_13_40_7]
MSAPVYDITGRSQGTVVLPKEFFGQKPNNQLLSQAIRVYFANQSSHKASTKTRSEVRGGGAKPWRQKGTGRARAGSKRSPVWVGGGIVFGPKPRNVQLSLPKKMRKKALAAALSAQKQKDHIKVISNFDKLEPKTKLAQNLLDKLNITDKTLVILDVPQPNVKLALRNIPSISVDLAANLNAYKVLAVQNLLISKVAIEKFK